MKDASRELMHNALLRAHGVRALEMKQPRAVLWRTRVNSAMKGCPGITDYGTEDTFLWPKVQLISPLCQQQTGSSGQRDPGIP